MSGSNFDLGAFESIFKESSTQREDVVSMARTSEAAERYEDMCKFMKYLVDLTLGSGPPLTVEERNLLSVAYKNVIGTRRASWRTLTAESEGCDQKIQDLIVKYTEQVEQELLDTCNEVLDVLKKLLDDDPALEVEAKVFYLKMAGDYYRYLAESISTNTEYQEEASKYYKKAYDAALEKDSNGDPALVPTHPIRLGLALNYSVCHYEILKDKKSACELAKQAFDDAIAKLDKLEENDYKDSTLIMQLLRDNLTLWSASDSPNVECQVEDLSDEEN